MYRSLASYNMDVYVQPEPCLLSDYAADLHESPSPSERYSHGPETNGELQFRGRGIRTGSTTLPPNNRTENWELCFADKSITGSSDIEKEATTLPSLAPSA